MKWAITLVIGANETIESRFKDIFGLLTAGPQEYTFLISDIEAFGEMGDQLSEKASLRRGPFSVSKEELLTLITEQGQIIELDLELFNGHNFEIIVREGTFFDVLGDSEFPPEKIGDFSVQNVRNFGY
ncbi:MAG: hypothetical protein Q8938_15260 [Bacteroidota bacterium]|nr:hypothetical protein [Bacteroidota bacterium]MDP4260055.1 hypothetical protein [Bacteroidota bacterium]